MRTSQDTYYARRARASRKAMNNAADCSARIAHAQLTMAYEALDRTTIAATAVTA